MKKLITKVNCKHPGRYDEWTLTPECERRAIPIAKKLGLPLLDFLTRLSNGEFNGSAQLAIENAPAGFNVTKCDDIELWKRVEKAAERDGETVAQFCWASIASMINGSEESCIFDAQNNIVGDGLDLEDFRKRCLKEDPPPRSREAR